MDKFNNIPSAWVVKYIIPKLYGIFLSPKPTLFVTCKKIRFGLLYIVGAKIYLANKTKKFNLILNLLFFLQQESSS